MVNLHIYVFGFEGLTTYKIGLELSLSISASECWDYRHVRPDLAHSGAVNSKDNNMKCVLNWAQRGSHLPSGRFLSIRSQSKLQDNLSYKVQSLVSAPEERGKKKKKKGRKCTTIPKALRVSV